MRSLRSRLIVGSALIAVIPLAVVMIVLSHRIEALVRTQAAERLGAALGGLEVQLESDGVRLDEKLAILGRDPTLKRLYLLQPAGSRDLSEQLAERRILLGLDFLQIADLRGVVIADAAGASSRVIEEGDSTWIEPLRQGGRHAIVALRVNGARTIAVAASAPIPYENQRVGSVRGGWVLDAAFLERLKRTSGVDLVLRDHDGSVLASTLPGAAGRTLAARPDVQRVELAGAPYLSRDVPLRSGVPPLASINGLVSTLFADRTIAALQLTSALLGLAGLTLAILLGILWSSQISRPVERLAAFSHRMAQGEWDDPLTLRSVGELETLVSALERMRTDLRAYRARLVTSERQAAWSEMARKVAHEVKNPLTPIAVSVADLKRSFDQKRPDFPEILDQAVRTVGEEVATLKHMLQEFSDFARLPPPRLAPCGIRSLFSDLEALYGREVEAGRLTFARPDREITFAADAGQIRQALVNLIKNGLEAVEGGGRVAISGAADDSMLELAVSDTGPGLGAEQRAHLFVPGFTTKREGSGLGLTIVERIVNDHGGTIAVESDAGNGTRIRIRLPMNPRV